MNKMYIYFLSFFRLAADTEEDDETSLAKILQASDEINKVIDRWDKKNLCTNKWVTLFHDINFMCRYKMVVIQGKPDILKSSKRSTNDLSDQLLDLNDIGSR